MIREDIMREDRHVLCDNDDMLPMASLMNPTIET